MATGLTAGERVGQLARKATSASNSSQHEMQQDAEYSLSYVGKLAESEILSTQPREFVALDPSGGANPCPSIEANSLVVCDNIDGLTKALESQAGSTKLIYADPPYATGLGFQSRTLQHAYDDHVGDARYLEFMRRRLILCRELLADDGSLYLHIGHQMVAEMKVLLDEIFGRRNFRNLIARRKCSSKNSTRRSFPNLLDFVLFYSKSNSYQFNPPTEQASEEWLAREYDKQDSKGRFKLVPVHAPGVRNGASGSAWRGKLPPPGKHWQYVPERLEELDRLGEIHWSSTGNPRRKVYLDPAKSLPLTDYWADFRDAHHQSVQITGYPTEKNLAMLKKIVQAGSSPGDLVVDPFTGSGTTLHAADDLGRKWIGFEQSLVAVAATAKRLRHGLSRMGDYVSSRREVVDLFGRAHSAFSVVAEREFYLEHGAEIVELGLVTPEPR